jgi:hypothetical protein
MLAEAADRGDHVLSRPRASRATPAEFPNGILDVPDAGLFHGLPVAVFDAAWFVRPGHRRIRIEQNVGLALKSGSTALPNLPKTLPFVPPISAYDPNR